MSTDGAVRVSDAERAQVADRLARAPARGGWPSRKYDERVRAAHGAVVRDDLAPLLVDLPGPVPAEHVPAVEPVVAGGRSHHQRPALRVPPGLPGLPLPPGGLRGAVATWAVVSGLNVAIWLAVVLGTGSP